MTPRHTKHYAANFLNGEIMAKVLNIAGCGLATVALILAIAAVAVNSWMTYLVLYGSGIVQQGSAGLWIVCDNGICSRIEDPAENITEVRVTVIVGIILLPMAIVCAFMKLKMKDKDALPLIGGAIAGVAGLSLMLAMVLFHTRIYNKFLNGSDAAQAWYSYGFGLDIAAWILAWVAVALMIASKFVDK